MATLGLIGSGQIGSTLARLAVERGLDVVLSNSRGPQTLSGLVEELGPQARAATAAEAAAAGDWVVVTIPVKAYPLVPAPPLVGKTVIDTGNYYPARDGKIPELESGETTSSELLQRLLPGAHVVKAFNNISYQHLAALPQPMGAADRSALAITGDDAAAKERAGELISRLGYDPLDAGPLADGRWYQPGTPGYGRLYARDRAEDFWARPAEPASRSDVEAALAAARA